MDSECNHENVGIKFDGMENFEEDRLLIPMECENCGEKVTEEISLSWELHEEKNESCSHKTILIDYDETEVFPFKYGSDILVVGECNGCKSIFMDEHRLLFEN